jgi:hypothetical protein
MSAQHMHSGGICCSLSPALTCLHRRCRQVPERGGRRESEESSLNASAQNIAYVGGH